MTMLKQCFSSLSISTIQNFIFCETDPKFATLLLTEGKPQPVSDHTGFPIVAFAF